jgi:hypothetical protein
MTALLAHTLLAALTTILGLFAGQGHIAGPRQSDDGVVIQQQTLYRGCNDIVVTAPVHTPWVALLNHIADTSAVVGMWRLDNAAQRYRAVYFASNVAPLDGDPDIPEPRIAVWICVNSTTSIS